jgi:outer membrane protein OmpU
MKKILFASTAIVAATMITSGTASASEKINLQLGGFSKWWVVGVWNSADYQQSSATAGGTNARSYNNVDVKGDNEVWFGGSTTLDNGLKVGVDIHLEAGGHTDVTTDTIDKSYIYVEGGYGKIIAGKVKNGTSLLHVQAPDAAGNWGNGGIMTGNYAVAKPASVNIMSGGNTTTIDSVGNSKVITYVAPTFYGLTVGASYLPTANTSSNAGGVDASRTTANIDAGATLRDIAGAGALYANTFAGVGVKVSAGAVTAKYRGDQNITTSGNASALPSTWFEQAYGTQLTYAGFTLGGSWHQQRNNGVNDTADAASLGEQTQYKGSLGNGSSFDLGLQYATGPYAVSMAYYHSAVQHNMMNANAALNGNDTVDAYQLSGKYSLGAGVDLLASAGYIEYNGAAPKVTPGDVNHNSGWTVMSGLSLTF